MIAFTKTSHTCRWIKALTNCWLIEVHTLPLSKVLFSPPTNQTKVLLFRILFPTNQKQIHNCTHLRLEHKSNDELNESIDMVEEFSINLVHKKECSVVIACFIPKSNAHNMNMILHIENNQILV